MTPRSSQGGRYLLPLVAVLATAVAVGAWLRFGDPEALTSKPALSAQKARTQRYAGAPNAIAVLPFRPDGRNGETSPHAFGFAHDLLRELARRAELQVIAPTSSLYFRDSPDQRRRIASRLQAAWLLGGDWWLDGESLRLRLELYRSDTGVVAHEWTWEASFDDPRRRVREVAAEVVERLPLETTEPPAAPGGLSADAWRHYAEGVFHASAAGEPDPARADAALRNVLEGNEHDVDANVLRAELLLHPAWPEAGRVERVEEARRIAGNVLERAPRNGRALGLLAWILHDFDWDWTGALRRGSAAVEADPGDAAVLRLAGLAAFTVGDFERAVAWLEAAAVRDPLNLGGRVQLGLAQEHARQDEAALLTLRQVAMLNPGYPGVHASRARLKLLQGKPVVAEQEAAREADPFWSGYAHALVLAGMGREPASRIALDALAAEYGEIAAFQVAELLAMQGRVDEAFDWLERAVEQRDGGLSALLGNRLLEPLYEDARWIALLEQLGLPLDSVPGGAENE